MAAAATLAAACAGEYSPRDRLITTTTHYYEAFRWSKADEMQDYVSPDMQLAFRKEYEEKFRDIKIVDYEVTEIRLDDSKKSARVTVAFAWHPLDETIIREAVVVDTWKSSKSKWYREGQEVLSGEVP
jgi:hypothetical protein